MGFQFGQTTLHLDSQRHLAHYSEDDLLLLHFRLQHRRCCWILPTSRRRHLEFPAILHSNHRQGPRLVSVVSESKMTCVEEANVPADDRLLYLAVELDFAAAGLDFGVVGLQEKRFECDDQTRHAAVIGWFLLLLLLLHLLHLHLLPCRILTKSQSLQRHADNTWSVDAVVEVAGESIFGVVEQEDMLQAVVEKHAHSPLLLQALMMAKDRFAEAEAVAVSSLGSPRHRSLRRLLLC
jgi:hypothetical protein